MTDSKIEIRTAGPGLAVKRRRSRSALSFMDSLNAREGRRTIRQRRMSYSDGWRYAAKLTASTRRVDRHAEVRKYY